MPTAHPPRSPRGSRIDLRRMPGRKDPLKFVPRPAQSSATCDASPLPLVSQPVSQPVSHHAHAEPTAVLQASAPTGLDASREDRACANDAYTTCSNPLPPAVRRVAVHGVRRTADAGIAHVYGVFVYDTAGHEHALVQYPDAASATFAALRLGQMYRVGVEFGNFSDPKSLRRLHD